MATGHNNKRTGPQEKATLHLDLEAATRLRVHAAVHRQSLSDTVSQLILTHLKPAAESAAESAA